MQVCIRSLVRALTTNGPSPPATSHQPRVEVQGELPRDVMPKPHRRYIVPCRPPPRSTGEPRDSEACVVCTHSYAPHTPIHHTNPPHQQRVGLNPHSDGTALASRLPSVSVCVVHKLLHNLCPQSTWPAPRHPAGNLCWLRNGSHTCIYFQVKMPGDLAPYGNICARTYAYPMPLSSKATLRRPRSPAYY